jgi:hypothetical protein
MAQQIKRVAVFCGSGLGRQNSYQQEATRLGNLLAKQKIGLVYGGASIGIMGVLANTVLEHHGEVIGVIPEELQQREIAHAQLTSLEVVRSMHERKARMAHLADAFVAIPGGYGTLDELIEIITWKQLGYHHKKIALMNTHHYFDPLLSLFCHLEREEFASSNVRESLLVAEQRKKGIKIVMGIH